jgi:hypothetical protein
MRLVPIRLSIGEYGISRTRHSSPLIRIFRERFAGSAGGSPRKDRNCDERSRSRRRGRARAAGSKAIQRDDTSSHRDRRCLRGWLACWPSQPPLRVAWREASHAEAQRASLAAKGVAYAATGIGYPIVHLPPSLLLASAIRNRGAEEGNVVPRAAFMAWVVYHVAKTLIHRERPPSQQGDANDDRSYPSGHTTAAAAIALPAA